VDLDGADETHICPRREFNAYAPTRSNALHCFGVDFLSNKEVLELFRAFEPKEVEWLDDSSCNIIFLEDGVPSRVMQDLALGEDHEKPWVRTKPLSPNKMLSADSAGAKPKKGAMREVRLQVRPATEADRKDPGHSGHTDSVYYAHVKEQQVQHKQAVEARRMKKRQRMSCFNESRSSSKPPTPRSTGGVQAPIASSPFAPTPAAADAVSEATAAVAPPSCGASEAQASSNTGPADAAAGPVPPLRLGCRGLLDPLLFMRAAGGSSGAGASIASSTASTEVRDGGDKTVPASAPGLAEMLQRSEAEYASILGVGAASAPVAGTTAASPAEAASAAASTERRGRSSAKGGGRGRGRDGTPGRGGRRQRTPGRPEPSEAQQQRGRKRRPVEQDPRPVAEGVAAPQRGPRALTEVEAFLAKHRVRCQRFSLVRSFRSILYGQQQKRKKPAAPAAKGCEDNMADADPVGASKQATVDTVKHDESIPKDIAVSSSDAVNSKIAASSKKSAASKEELPPWEQYMRVNSKFVKQGQFVHTVCWDAGGRRVLAVVPHPLFVDEAKLAKAAQVPLKTVRRRKLKDMASETGWPLFVCVPFGHPKDAQEREPMLLIDSSLTEVKKPLLFDCGTVGLSLPVSEFLRSTRAACVEGLAYAKSGTSKVHVLAEAMTTDAQAAPAMVGSPEPAPEPAPVASPSSTTAQQDARGSLSAVDLPMDLAEAPKMPASLVPMGAPGATEETTMQV